MSWVLVLAVLQGGLAISGYQSLRDCEAAGAEAITGRAKISKWEMERPIREVEDKTAIQRAINAALKAGKDATQAAIFQVAENTKRRRPPHDEVIEIEGSIAARFQCLPSGG